MTATLEARVLATLSPDEGASRAEILMQTGLSLRQVSAALARLREKRLAECERWRETSVWFAVTPDEAPR